MSDQFSNSNIAIAPFPAFLWSQSAGAGAGKDPDWFHHALIITVHVYTCLLVTKYTCLLVTHVCWSPDTRVCWSLVTRVCWSLVTRVTSISCSWSSMTHCWCLMVASRSLFRSSSVLPSSAASCRSATSHRSQVMIVTSWCTQCGQGGAGAGGRKCAATRRSCKN